MNFSVITNSSPLRVGDRVKVLEAGPFQLEEYRVTEVMGSGNDAQYALQGVNTGEGFSYFVSSELKKVGT